MGVENFKETLLSDAEQLKDKLVEWRRTLHANAETGFDLKNTVAFVKKELLKLGLSPIECGRAGLVATVGKGGGKVFLLRADMDALPIEEKSGVAFAAKNGNMHACGHDMHAAMLLGAAELLKAHENEIEGTVKLMFQPAEEIFEGSNDMIEAGVLKDPDVDGAMMIHVMANMPFPAGTVLISAAGVSAPAADYFTIEVRGKGCHGSMPNTGVDPLSAAAHILIGLQEIHARELAIGDRAVLTIGSMNGGVAPNVIPDTVTMGGSIRTFDEETRAWIKGRVEEIAQSIATAFRATATVSFGSGCPTLTNDKETVISVGKYVKELLKDKAISVSELQNGGGRVETSANSKGLGSAGSEDFAYVSQRVPSVMLALAAGEADKGYCYPQHHPKTMFDESVLSVGAAVYAYSAMRWLQEHER